MTTYTTSGLTTAFTPPPSCYSNGLTGTAAAYSFEFTKTINYQNADECYPYRTSLPYSYGTFSPGMCPGGYTTALSTSRAGRVIAACCPSNYDKVDWEAYCTSTRTTSMSVDCFYPQTTVGEGLSSCVPGLIGPGNAVQFAIHIMYASSDLPAFPTGYSSGGIGQGGFVTAPAFAEHIPGSTIVVSTDEAGSRSGTSGADKPSESPGSPGEIRTGLSTGAIAGVSVGAVLVIAALLVAVWLFLRRRKRRSSKKQAIGNVPTGRDDDKEVTFEHKSFSKDSKDVFTELDGRTKQMNELSGSGQVLLHNELSSVQDHRPHELPHKAIKATAIDHVVRLPQADGTSARNTPGDSSLSATNLGPVGDHLYNPYPGNHDADVVSRAQPAQSVVEQTNALQAREDVELRYLEDEEQRIRERKEAILANRAGS